MRKTIYVCNECGEEIHGNVGRIIPGIFDKNEELNPEDEKFPENDDVHFCVRCLRTVMDRITHAQGTHEDTEETAGAGVEEEPKEEKPVRRRKLDGGQDHGAAPGRMVRREDRGRDARDGKTDLQVHLLPSEEADREQGGKQ
jgi:hypothetical protein